LGDWVINPLAMKISDSNVFCGFAFIHRINPVFEIKNLLKQVEKGFSTRFSVFFMAGDEFIHRHFGNPQKKRDLGNSCAVSKKIIKVYGN
jgi:hypothetical protein